MYQLENIPYDERTYERCFTAVLCDNVPDEDREGDPELAYVPEKYKSRELCLAAVSVNGQSLRFVPDKVMSPLICMAAVAADAEALKYVPEELRSKTICCIAASKRVEMLEFVPQKHICAGIRAALEGDREYAQEYLSKEVLADTICS